MGWNGSVFLWEKSNKNVRLNIDVDNLSVFKRYLMFNHSDFFSFSANFAELSSFTSGLGSLGGRITEKMAIPIIKIITGAKFNFSISLIL